MKPKAYIFAGPTLAQSQLVLPDNVFLLPPAAQGDVYQAARQKPDAIGIVDGYFEGQASVWHKEILWAMDNGIHVFGSASMGALRAAELHVFGMQGVGKIFEAYRDGEFEDDDEVAVLHAPADAGFLTLSEPMVNIRATLEQAKKQGVIDAGTFGHLEHLAKKTFYQERRWPDLLTQAEQKGIAANTITEFKEWLPDHRVDQKEIDASLMIKAMEECLDQDRTPVPANYYFEWTEMWDEVVKNAVAPSNHHIRTEDEVTSEIILDEVRLEMGAFDPFYRLALLRRLASDAASPAQTRQQVSQAITAFRERNSLFSRTELDRWLQQHHLDAKDFEQLIADDVAIEECLMDWSTEIGRDLLDQLRLDGRYQQLAERALSKKRFLDSIGETETDIKDGSLSPPQLRAWYFEQQRREAIPLDLERYARSVGFKDRQALDQALRREYLYVVNQER